MNLQLSFSPKLTTLSLARELISSLKRLAASRYSMRSWHSLSVSSQNWSLSLGSLMNSSPAATWSSRISWTMRLASLSRHSCDVSSHGAATMVRSLPKTSNNLVGC